MEFEILSFSPSLILFYDSIKAYNLDDQSNNIVQTLMMNYSFKQVVLVDTTNRNSVMVATHSVDAEMSFMDPKLRFQKISCKLKNKLVTIKKHCDVNKTKRNSYDLKIIRMRYKVTYLMIYMLQARSQLLEINT